MFPSSLGCPHCGATVTLLPANEVETLDPNALGRGADPDEEEGEEPDAWARRAIWVGIALGILLILEAFFPLLGLAAALEATEIPKAFYGPVRGLIFLIGVYAISKGMLSLVNWSSGWRVYRKYRIKTRR